MKRTEIIILVVIALVAGIIVATYAGASDSKTFSEAQTNPGARVKITGNFDKTQGVEYNPIQNPNRTLFSVVDKEGQSRKVELIQKDGKPMGLEQSESITVEGTMGQDQVFHADYILMKCPSKYNEQKHQLK
jgi:cytochrome c-type biogenesis protein CcmE